MASRLRRVLISHTAVALAVVALPLLAAGSAQAAIAGANPATTTAPDLRSATIVSPQDVRVCWDQPILSTSNVLQSGDADFIEIRGYRALHTQSANSVTPDSATTGGMCVIATFDVSGGQDLNQFTALTTSAGSVTGSGTGHLSLHDSTTLVPSPPLTGGTHNGTAGLTTAPDLQAILAPTTGNNGSASNQGTDTLIFTFDQNVASANASDFYFVTPNGDVCFGDPGSTPLITNTTNDSPTTGAGGNAAVTVAFGQGNCGATGATPPNFPPSNLNVVNARLAGVFAGAVNSTADNGSFNPAQSVVAPNQVTASTTLPRLVSAQLQSNGSQVAYVFDQNISPADITDASDFKVGLSNGHEVSGCSATNGPNQTIIVTFDAISNSCNGGFSLQKLSNQDEYVVNASVTGNAVHNAGNTTRDAPSSGPGAIPPDTFGIDDDPLFNNVPGGVPAGANQGAFARGYTTGPDIQGVTFTPTAGADIAQVTVDQRVDDSSNCQGGSGGSSECQLIDKNGSNLGAPTNVVGPSSPPAGPESLVMDFTHGTLLNAVGFSMTGCALETFLSFRSGSDECSIPQIVAPIGTGAILKAYRSGLASAKAHHAKKTSRKHHKRHAKHTKHSIKRH